MTQKTPHNPWLLDVRVRERNLKSGSLTDKDLEKFLTALPDVADQSEAFGTPQPALEQPRQAAPVMSAPVVHHAHAAPVAAAASEPLGADENDEDEDEDEDDDDLDAAAPSAAGDDAAPSPDDTDNGEGTP
jgi:hypothetical protein